MPEHAESATFSTPKKRPASVPGRLIIRVEPKAVRPYVLGPTIALSRRESSRIPDSVAEPIDYLRRNVGLKGVDPLFSPRRSQLGRVPPSDRHLLAAGASVADAEDDELAGLTVADLPPGKLTPKVVKLVNDARGIAFAEPLPTRWLTATPDPEKNLQWGLRAINWFQARRPNASGVTVAVLDTGIDAKHPALPAPTSYDHTGTVSGDLIGHGTHVAGIIAAKTNDNVGITGGSNCRLAVWKVFPDRPQRGDDFFLDTERFLQVLGALPDQKIAVVNLSLGGDKRSRAEELLFRRLAKSGITTVAAMGNSYEDGNPTIFPAAYSDVIGVGSFAEDRRRSGFSNTGSHNDLLAPGSNILSTLPMRRSKYREETEYGAWSGTSMATPHVAAAAALLVARHTSWTPEQIRDRLVKTATHLDSMGKAKRTAEYGHGLLDVRAAVS